MKLTVLALAACTALSGCSSQRKRREAAQTEGDENTATRSKPTKDPDLVFDTSKISCKSICAGIEGCPVKQAHCKKESDPPVCWSLYYTTDKRTDWCFFRKDPDNCPEQLPVYCEAESGLVLPEFKPPTTTQAPRKTKATPLP